MNAVPSQSSNGLLSSQATDLIQRYTFMRRAFERLQEAVKPFWRYLAKLHMRDREHMLLVRIGRRRGWTAADVRHLWSSNTAATNGLIIGCFTRPGDDPNCKGLTPEFTRQILKDEIEVVREDGTMSSQEFRKTLDNALALLSPRNLQAATTMQEMQAGLDKADECMEEIECLLELMRMDWEYYVQPILTQGRRPLTEQERQEWREETQEKRLNMVKAQAQIISGVGTHAADYEDLQRSLQKLQAYLSLDMVDQLDASRNKMEDYGKEMFDLGF